MDSLDAVFNFKEDVTDVLAHLSSVTSLEDAQRKLPNSVTVQIEKMLQEGKSIEEALKDIKTYINTLKDIKIYLAFEPTKNLREKILDIWSSAKPHRYIEILVDPSLVGGAQVAVDGIYHDYSVNSSINAILAKKTQV